MASLEYRVLTGVDEDALEEMLVRGWRRFGAVYFRPACAACGECVSLRLPVARFSPTASQTRALRRSRRFHTSLGRPRVDAERLSLYAAWHHAREDERQWAPAPLGADEYFHQFAFPHPAARELGLWDGHRLVALGLVDVTPRAWSLVYFFYHPDVARLSLGIANVLIGVQEARRRGIPHVYLGYRVAGCASMTYKAGFCPHELLRGRPAPGEAPQWEEGSPPAHPYNIGRP